MCGRFLLTSPAGTIRRRFGVEATGPALRPRYNIAPGQDILVVHSAPDGRRRLTGMRWGLMPAWMTGPPGRPLINARIETVAERPAFRAAFRRRRCLVPADGWYEWRPQPGGPGRPFVFLAREDDRPFAFAALYEEAHTARWGERLPATVTLLTMPAWPAFAAIHDRMPVPLAPEGFAAWLDPDRPPQPPLAGHLALLPENAFTLRPVSRLLNRVAIDSPAILEAGESPAAGGQPPGTQGDLFG